MTPLRAEENLSFWRSLVGLDADFPALKPLADDRLMSAVIDETQLDVILSSLASQQLNHVVVDPGWGATTLFRYLVHAARDRVMERLTLPIAIDLESMFKDVEITPELLGLEIRRQMLGLMIGNPWESTLNRDYYYECIDYESTVPLPRFKAEASAFLFASRAPTERKLVQRFPWLRGKLGEQVSFLLANLRIQTALYVHLPPDIDEQRMRDLVSSIKWIARETPDMEYAAWRETYISSRTLAPQLSRDFDRPFEPINYPRYSPVQVYLMLMRRYGPSLSGLAGRQQLTLDSVFAAEFIDDAWRDATTLNDLVARVSVAILQRLDCPPNDVPFKLEPPSVGAEPMAEEIEELPRKLTFAERRAAATAAREERQA